MFTDTEGREGTVQETTVGGTAAIAITLPTGGTAHLTPTTAVHLAAHMSKLIKTAHLTPTTEAHRAATFGTTPNLDTLDHDGAGRIWFTTFGDEAVITFDDGTGINDLVSLHRHQAIVLVLELTAAAGHLL